MPADRTAEVADLAVARQRGKQAAAEAANATHHDLVNQWLQARTLGAHRPVYAAGALHLPDESGLWLPTPLEAVEVQFAAMFPNAKLCRKHSDYRQLATHAAAVTLDAEFFEQAPPGVASAKGFHKINAAGSVETVPLTHRHRQTFALAHGPDADAEAPLMDGLIAAAFANDHEAAQTALLWEVFGAAMFGLLPQHQVAVLLLGVQGSGKSTFQRILESAFPREAVCAVSPSQWGHEYHVAALAGKRLNVVGELADDAPIPAAPFKNVTGLNLVGARHPTHRPFSFRSTAANVFASNVLPPTTDRSEAFYRRWRVLRFANTVPPERIDHGLLDKIIGSELGAIIAQAFQGAERVARAGKLSTTPAHLEVLSKWRHAANPLQQFLADDEWVELDPAAQIHAPREVYETYRRWSAAAGFRNPFGRNHFLDLLESTGAGLGVRKRRVDTRELVVGLRLLRAE